MSMDRSHGPVIIEKRVSQWEELMKQFSEAHTVKCKSVSLDIPRAPRSVKNFPTGSSYEGTWNVLGMSGFGVYVFPNGVIYEGAFEEGMFHGEGELQYESGEVLAGKWNKGVLVERNLTFDDGLAFSDKDWKYCQMPDRRFTVEYVEGLLPAGNSVLTADLPTREIPFGFYDTGDGFYDPKTKSVYKADDMTTVIRSPSAEEQKWIIDNCRTNPDMPLGPRPDLYEEWMKPELTEPYVPPPAAGSRAYSGFDDPEEIYQDEDEADMNKPKAFYDSRRSTQTIRSMKTNRSQSRSIKFVYDTEDNSDFVSLPTSDTFMEMSIRK